jgi:hypothetical protein
MAWILFTTSDVPLRQDVIDQVTTAVGRGDLLTPIIAGVITEIVGKVAVRNPVGVSGTIPEELLDAAKSLAAFRFVVESGTDELLTEGLKTRNANAIALLKDVASGEFKLVPPVDYAPVQAQSPSPRITPARRAFSPQRFDGI